ncbi:ATP-dependent Clp protease ATP-binding subunit, partial [candidate division WWE3 bacterium]|nr:ATP-dependent Clp protease ATP-binding subunit [candidate division WWE3 bacterium]
DMSEYMEKHSVSKMIGAPPGYIGYDKGGQLTDIVRRKPFSIILLDEVEKAHPDVFNTLLQIMEDGRLTDSKGRKVDFKNTIIIMTSNIGSEELRRATIGFNSANKKINQEDSEIKSKVMKALKDTFKPEFLNRIDEIVLFKALGIDDIKQIVDKELAKTQLRLNEYMISLDVTPKAKEYLAENGYSEEYGARPVKRLIQKEIENVISQMIIESTVAEGDTVKIGITKGALDIVVDSKIASKVGS